MRRAIEGAVTPIFQRGAALIHALRHQNGGADEINVAALSGLLADGQTPLAHVASHAKAGSDILYINALGGVSVPILFDGDYLYYDMGAALWRGRPLSPVVLAVAAALVHAARHQNGGADEISVAALSGLLADDQHVLDAEVLAVAAALVHASRHETGGADEISIAALLGESASLAAHKILTAGVHGAGGDHLALFGVASTIVSKFTPHNAAIEIWRRDNACNSSFEAFINGNPTSTSVVYDTDVRENSLPDPTARPQWGKVILHNITRSNSRKITDVNIATNTITTEASVDNWANNDIITIGSQTCVSIGAYTYSRYFDIDISDEVPATTTAVLIEMYNYEKSGVSVGIQNGFGLHPYEAHGAAKAIIQYASSAYEFPSTFATVGCNGQKVCGQLGIGASINGAGTIGIFRIRGYWE